MSVVAFDTHRIVKRLMEVGFSDLQAEAVTDVLSEGRNLDLSHLATKADLAATKAELKADTAALKSDLAATRAELKSDIAGVKAELKSDLAGIRSELKSEMASITTELQAEAAAIKSQLRIELADNRADLLKWVIGAIGIQTLVVVGAVVALARAI